MTKTPIEKLIISLGIPTIVSMLITNVYNMADTYFVGRLIQVRVELLALFLGLWLSYKLLVLCVGRELAAVCQENLAKKISKVPVTMLLQGWRWPLLWG